MENWQKYREIFPHVKHCVYLNHAAVSPLQRLSIGAIQEYLYKRSHDNIEYWPEALEVKHTFKRLIGLLINASAEHIALSSNTSMGLNWLAQGLEWKPGDRILLNNFEFPSNVYPFLNLKRRGVAIDFVEHREGRINVDDIVARITPETCLLSISFVEFLNGFRNDLKKIGEICRENNIIFCVDGIQGVGALEMDVEEFGIDFLSCGGHKWLMWPMGTAFIYISPRIFEQVWPMALGWLSMEDSWDLFSYQLNLRKTAERFEPGVFNVIGLIGAIATLELFLEIGVANIERKILDTTDYLVERLTEENFYLYTPLEKKHRSGIVTFRHPKGKDLVQSLAENHIHVSLREGVIRVSPHFYNTKAEIDLLMQEILNFNKTSKKQRKKLVV